MAKRHKKISFRSLAEADYAALPRLTGTADESAAVFWEAADPASPTAIRELLRSRQDVTVAEVKGRVVGLGALYEVEEGRQGYLGPVVVDPEYRGHGVGSMLVSRLLDVAFRGHRVREVRARIPGDNEDGVVMLSEMGFMPYSHEEHATPDGRSRVVVQMRINRRGHQDND
ncbi:GNAT family N-acetyltransferase [Thioalkalivibrio denitrificans]|uniref:GNAT family N-acetyltransferase n=1 Tax=Thioalkalivibrio denitrificans TaxID=108003 RepID=A0A1V3NCQ3_9GAMM|nr:GNAT family N-acetyltransferase [Thioalkalivibrio denitrificans]OOG22804.1 GNAT family N-acetyltransferase [Thioalkalivibrio denitrificans]